MYVCKVHAAGALGTLANKCKCLCRAAAAGALALGSKAAMVAKSGGGVGSLAKAAGLLAVGGAAPICMHEGCSSFCML